MLLFSISENIPTLGISRIGILLEVHVKGFLKAFNSEFMWNGRNLCGIPMDNHWKSFRAKCSAYG